MLGNFKNFIFLYSHMLIAADASDVLLLEHNVQALEWPNFSSIPQYKASGHNS